MYTAPIDAIIKEHGVNAMLYAEDTQLYITFKNMERNEAVTKLNSCLADIKVWAARNKLALNDAKTEVIYFR